MKQTILLLSLLVITQVSTAQDFVVNKGETIQIFCDTNRVDPIVRSTIKMFTNDVSNVFDGDIRISNGQGKIELSIDNGFLNGKKEAFGLNVKNGRLKIIGSDSHGLAYGLLELSRLMGVSPWEWWADHTPSKIETFRLPDGYQNTQSPSVEYRGIFINDEDWGLMPWSSLNYEATLGKGKVGPKTNERIFQLMLRLRANTYWPAMHECTYPFFLTKGNKEMAERYGIYIGGSHCEPMASSTAGEWSLRGQGDYDYVNNSKGVYRFWEDRLKEVSNQEILYTLGMRGVHDGAMNGAKTVEEQKKVLDRVFRDQRALLGQYVDKNLTKIPQVFIPYKEVLNVYNAGLSVPEDVALMWCDDNYGYIRHFPNAVEKKRKGGNGVYYHVSYWGRPHDYLWLGTFSPALLYQQMSLAYNEGIQRIWILNVGDIKPTEYQLELFMDMAWNIDGVHKTGLYSHLENYLKREFGETNGRDLLPIMKDYYRLAFIRKPEFMGNTREEEKPVKDYRKVKDMPWSMSYIDSRLDDYQVLSDKVEAVSKQIPASLADTYFQLVKYPVQACDQMNRKLLYAQKARHGMSEYWRKSDVAYDSIARLTNLYNSGIANSGKWRGMMDYRPRRLPVFEPVERSVSKGQKIAAKNPIVKLNGTDCISGNFTPCEGLGYEEKAIALMKGKSITFALDNEKMDSIDVEFRFLPTHSVDCDSLRVEIEYGGVSKITNLETYGRSEEWKENVLNNHTVRTYRFKVGNRKKNSLVIRALDQGIVLDQILVYSTD